MSRNINVNPAHYKVAGRERQGEDIIQRDQKQLYASQPGGGHHGEVPPWEATRHSFATAQPEPERKPAKAPRRARKAAKAKKATKARKAPKAKKTTGAKATRAKATRAKKPTAARTPTRRKRAAPKRSAARRSAGRAGGTKKRASRR